MLIRNLAVEGIGRFTGAARVEGFGEGVNVLPAGNRLTYFYADYQGWGQSGPIGIAADGTYRVQVSSNYDYQDEYRDFSEKSRRIAAE